MALFQSFQFPVLLNRIAFFITLIAGITVFYFLLRAKKEFLYVVLNSAFILLSLLPSFVYLLFVRKQKFNVPVLYGGIFLGVVQIAVVAIYPVINNLQFTSVVYLILIPASIFSYVWGYIIGSVLHKKRKL